MNQKNQIMTRTKLKKTNVSWTDWKLMMTPAFKRVPVKRRGHNIISKKIASIQSSFLNHESDVIVEKMECSWWLPSDFPPTSGA